MFGNKGKNNGQYLN